MNNEYHIDEWRLVSQRAENLIGHKLSLRVLEAVRHRREQVHALKIQCMVALALTIFVNGALYLRPTDSKQTASSATTIAAERSELLSSL